MAERRRTISLGFCAERLLEGQHICYIFNDEQERRRVMSQFFQAGLRDGDKMLYLADTMSPTATVDWLRELGVEVPERPGALTVGDAALAYCPDGSFSSPAMLAAIQSFYFEALKEGYPGSRGTGEMSWCLVEGRADPAEVMTYEAGLTTLIESYPYTACCQYDARRFDGETILDVLSVHPMMIVRGQCFRNPYFVPPSVFLKEYRERKQLRANA
jgi:hypothetical protein